MKKDKLLLVFILIVMIGIIFINFIFTNGLNKKELIQSDKIKVPSGYKVSIVLKGLKNPASIVTDKSDNLYIAENINGKGRVIKYTKEGEYSVLINHTSSLITNLAFHSNILYISQRGAISKLENGEVHDIVNGLPSIGDYSNNGIAFGYDGMIYICQGSATNSGIVGIDNYEKGWLMGNPYFHDYPPVDTVLGGINFKSKNPLNAYKHSRANTGAFLPFNTMSLRSEAIKGRQPGNACILRISPNGNIEDTYAWGIRNPVGIVILPDTRVFVSVQGMEDRGSRPIANGKDYIYEITKGEWLGWPDYEGGEPVIQKKFKSKNHAEPQFILELHPSVNPPKPLVAFKESGRIGIMDMNSNANFGFKNNLFIPLKKGINEEAKVVAYDIKNNKVLDFITNNEKSDFLLNPVQCCFSKDGKLYVLENNRGLLIEVTKDNLNSSSILPGSLPVEYFIGVIIVAFVIYLAFSIRKKG